MTPDRYVGAVADFGFTPRQAAFLVMVMRHSGVCLDRQYCAYGQIAHGQATRGFFADLVRRGFATAYACRHNRARVYHVQHKALYRAIDEPHNRNRRPAFLGRAVERLMVLDVVLASPDVTWFATEKEKLAHFTALLGAQLRRDELPSLTFGSGTASTVRYFPDKVPIGFDAQRDEHVFLYLVTRSLPIDFRAFLHRHGELLRATRRWSIRLLVPRHLQAAATPYRDAFGQEIATPLGPSILTELRWFFHQRGCDGPHTKDARYQRAARAFAAPRFAALYRAWLRRGDAALDEARSPVLSDALARQEARLDTHILPRAYNHLLPLVGTS